MEFTPSPFSLLHTTYKIEHLCILEKTNNKVYTLNLINCLN